MAEHLPTATRPIAKVNLTEAFGRIDVRWHPRVAAEVNDAYVKLAKVEGEFVWHRHDAEDELFLVVKGSLPIRLQDREIRLETGEFVVVPAGVDHLPVAAEEAHILLLQPKTTRHTGNVHTARTVETTNCL